MAQKIFPFLWFNKNAAEAAKFYVSIFKGRAKLVDHDPMSATFKLDGHEYVAFNGGSGYKLNPAFSLMVTCKTQKEIDTYWKRLTAGGKVNRCGWLRDKYGLHWQIVPEILPELFGDPDREKAGRAFQAMMKMKKFDIAALKRAHAGR